MLEKTRKPCKYAAPSGPCRMNLNPARKIIPANCDAHLAESLLGACSRRIFSKQWAPTAEMISEQ